MRVCPNCQATVSDTANFCDNCGRPFRSSPVTPRSPAPDPFGSGGLDLPAVICSACGYHNVPGEMFCQNCGVQLAPVASVPPPPPTPVTVPPAIPPPSPTMHGLCPECGVTVTLQDVFCPNCGAHLEHHRSSAHPAPPEAAPPPVETAPQPAAAPAAPPEPHTPPVRRPELRLVVKDSGKQLSTPTAPAEFVIGRSDPVRSIFPDVDLGVAGGDTRGVSRRHARVFYRDDRYQVEDLNSTNFTFLNRQRLEPGQLYPLQDGDELRVGLLALQVVIR